MNNLLRIWKFYRVDAPQIAWVAGLMLLSTGVGLLKPWPLAILVDTLLAGRPVPAWLQAWTVNPAGQLTVLTLAVLGLHVGQAALSALHNYWLIRIGLRGLARVRSALFHWLQRLSWRFHQQSASGDLLYRASWDVYSFQTLFQHGWFTTLNASLSLAFMMIIMWQTNARLTLVALAMIPLLLAAMRVFGGPMHRRTRLANESDSRVITHLEQTLTALPLIQSYTREPVEEARFHQRVQESLRQRQCQHGWEIAYLAAIAVVFALGITGILWTGARQIQMGRLSLGQLLVFLAYLTQFYEPLNQLSSVGATVSSAGAGVQRVFEILDTPEEVEESPHALQIASAAPASTATGRAPDVVSGAVPAAVGISARAHSGRVIPFIRGEIELDQVSFAYQPGRPVLHHLSCRLNPGESMAIVGPSGAGKSTLLHLLPRFFDPSSGIVRLDGIDLRTFKLRELRQQVALVMQEPLLLPGTIAENIAYGRPEASQADIEAAAQAAFADQFIQQLPQGYRTVVGEGAARLSAGEKQRINLARAFLKNAPLLVLDEPTSALDAESEAFVVASLRQLMQSRTTLIVAHRLSTIRQASQILVLDQGRIVESGPPEQLLRQAGYFARLASGI